MPTLAPEEILIAGTGTLYHAPQGTALPGFLSDVLDPAFQAVGYITEDGAKFTDTKDTNKVMPWQSFYPVRVHITGRSGQIETTLLQWNEQNMILAYGGGGIIEPQSGEFRYEPPSPETLAVVAVVIDFTDGDRNFRFAAGRSFVVSATESMWNKTGPALLPVTLEILAPAEGDQPWTIDSDDPAWTPIAS